MTWDFYDSGEEFILKAKKEEPKTILNSLDKKQTKRLKKTLQAAEPTEFFGQDFTKMGDLIDVLKISVTNSSFVGPYNISLFWRSVILNISSP